MIYRPISPNFQNIPQLKLVYITRSTVSSCCHEKADNTSYGVLSVSRIFRRH